MEVSGVGWPGPGDLGYTLLTATTSWPAGYTCHYVLERERLILDGMDILSPSRLTDETLPIHWRERWIDGDLVASEIALQPNVKGSLVFGDLLATHPGICVPIHEIEPRFRMTFRQGLSIAVEELKD